MDWEEQHIGTQQFSSGEASIARSEANSAIGAGIPKPHTASPAGVLINEGNRVPQRSQAGTGTTRDANRELQLSTKILVATRTASHSYNTYPQLRTRCHQRRA
jgi:hypothetical protein